MPPARGELPFHLNQVYHQLQIWVTTHKAQLDELDPNFYGWTLEKNEFVVSIAPADLVKIISCNYKGF